MQKTSSSAYGCPQRDRTASEGYVGVQTYMEIVEGSLVESHFGVNDLMEQIIDLPNLRAAYNQVVRNKGKGGVDGMEVKELFSWCQSHIEDLRPSLMDGTYVSNPVRRVEIPKDNGKKRLLGIPTVIDRMVQQAISQVLSRIYEPQFSRTSYGFRPKRGAHDALREARKNVTDGYKYAVGIDLERFFDTVNQSKLIEVLSRTIKDGRVVSLIHKYLRGWITYFQLADMQHRVKAIDEWLRRRYRMCIWKAWKKCRTKVKNLIKCGISEWQAYEWGNSSKKYWRVAKSPILHRAIGNEALRRQGWPCLMDYHRLIVRVQ